MRELVEFLLARIAEEQALAERITRTLPSYIVKPQVTYEIREQDGAKTIIEPVLVYDADRALVECEAKRRIVMQYVDAWNGANLFDGEEYETVIFPLLALPYADHPDYREEWKP